MCFVTADLTVQVQLVHKAIQVEQAVYSQDQQVIQELQVQEGFQGLLVSYTSY